MSTIRQERMFEWALARSRTLHESVLWGHGRELQQMLLMGANPNLYEGGYTPLHLAAKKCRYAFVLLLLAYGADPEATDNIGQTALVIFRKRHAFGPLLCLPTNASNDAHEALCLPALRVPTLTLPQTAFYALRDGPTDVEFTDISIVSPSGEVHLARVVKTLE